MKLYALRTALQWAVGEGMAIPGLMSEKQLAQLNSVFTGNELWSFDLYEPLRAFGHAFHRLDLENAPATLCFADLLAALNQLALADLQREPSAQGPYLNGLKRYSWALSSQPSNHCLEALGYPETSDGISRMRESNLAGWSQHARHSKSLIQQVAKQLPGKTAAVIGAGKAHDIPLLELVERYEKLILVDIDKIALEATVARTVTDPEQRRRIELVGYDATGIGNYFQETVDAIVASGGSEETVYAELLAFLYSYRGAPLPQLFPAGEVDTIYSVMVLTQLATPLTRYAEARFAERFPKAEATASQQFQIALGQFTHRVQHAHVEAILASCKSFSISSDVAEHYVEVTALGGTRAISGELPLIGAQRLDELLPSEVERIAVVEWTWPRVAPRSSGKPGTTLRVHGLVGRPN